LERSLKPYRRIGRAESAGVHEFFPGWRENADPDRAEKF